MENEEAVLNFMQFTGVEDMAVARNFCETSGWNVESAVSSYFSNPNLFSAAVSAPNETPFIQEEPVREAIPAHFATLSGPTHMMNRAPPRQEPFRDYGAEWTRNGTNQDTRGLANLFAPPSYVFKGTLAEACQKGIDSGKWILINIQATEEFASHVLNRDVWKDSSEISPLIREHFIFCQRDKDSQFGRTFLQLYNMYGENFPLVSIIDPVTRAHLRKIPLSAQPTVQELMPCILQFMEKHDKPGFSEDQKFENTEQTENFDDFDEETRKALAMSLEENLPQENFKPAATVQEQQPEEQKMEKVESEMKVQEPEQYFDPPTAEPPKDSSSTTLRIQLPDGSSLRRRFLKTDNISVIYAALEHEQEKKYGNLEKFVLKTTFPKQTLGGDTLDCTLETKSLMNCRLLLEAL